MVFVTFLMLVVVLTISLQMVFSRHFQYEESQQNILNMQRVQAAFENNYIILNYLAKEWSDLPEIAAFIKEGNEDFIQRHVQVENIKKLGLDFLLIQDSQTQIVYGGFYDLDQQQFLTIDPTEISDLVKVFSEGDNQGIMIFDQRPLMMVSSTIYDGNNNQVVGQLILGRFFTQDDLQNLARQVKFPMEMALMSGDVQTNDFNLARNYYLNNNELTYMSPVSEFHVAGYVLIKDLNQQPALILRAEQYRYVTRNADVVLRYMLLALIISATVFAAIILGVMEQTVLSRLSRLNREVQTIAHNPLKSGRVTTDKKDEISSVSANINRMLEALETSQQERFDELSTLFAVSQLFLKQEPLLQTQKAICTLAMKHCKARAAWLGERNPDGRMQPLVAAGMDITAVEPVTLVDHTLHNYMLKPAFVLSSKELYALSEADEIYYAIVIPLNWGNQAKAIYIVADALPVLGEQENQFFSSFGSLTELVLSNTLLLNEVKSSQLSLQKLSRQLVQVHEEERRNLARELHDEIGQYLTALKLRLGSKARVTGQLDQSLLLVHELIQKVRKISLDLRPSVLDDLGLLPALEWYFERYTQQTGIVVDFDPQNLERQRFSNEIEITIFRIVQESLTNVARHANVEQVFVRLETRPDEIALEIEDEGAGFAMDAQKVGSSSGLTGMVERARLLQGSMEIQSRLGKGTIIKVRIPLQEEGE
jgi:signal transduction histidine kinase